jgi:hypothetical protein
MLFGVRARAAQDMAVSLDDYWALVEETRDALVNLPALAETTQQDRLAELARHWQSIDSVILPDGTRLPVDHDAIVGELDTARPEIEKVAAVFEAVSAIRAVTADAPFADGSATEALARLEVILSQPAFQWEQKQPSFWARLWERIDRFLFNLLPDEVAGGNLFVYLLTGVGIVALAGILFAVARSLLVSFAPESKTGGVMEDEAPLTAEAALGQARERSRGGDYRNAVRYLYLSTLLLLDERGLLRYDRARTNREYLRAVADRPDLSETLRDVVDVFDRVWYGFQPIDDATYAHYEDQVTTLRRQG